MKEFEFIQMAYPDEPNWACVSDDTLLALV